MRKFWHACWIKVCCRWCWLLETTENYKFLSKIKLAKWIQSMPNIWKNHSPTKELWNPQVTWKRQIQLSNTNSDTSSSWLVTWSEAMMLFSLLRLLKYVFLKNSITYAKRIGQSRDQRFQDILRSWIIVREVVIHKLRWRKPKGEVCEEDAKT